jgi:hypothetical protein
MSTKIEWDTPLSIGMFIATDGNIDEPYKVIYSGRFRNNEVLCVTSDGYSLLVPAWNGEYVILHDQIGKYKIVYGETVDNISFLSRRWYKDVEEFKALNTKYKDYYAEIIRSSLRFFESKERGFGE